MADTSTTESVLTFAEGIPGFPQSHRFLLGDLPEPSAFSELRSLDDPDVALIVAVPWLFFPDYAPELGPEAAASLELVSPEDATVFCAVTVDTDARQLTMNLRGPFVVNARTRAGAQVVLDDHTWPVRAPIPLES